MQGSPRIDELRQKFHENPRRYFAPLANEYRKAGDPEQAIAICRAHLAQQPGHMSGHVVYGQALYDARRPDEARTVFEKALELDPDNAVVLRRLGDIAREKGESSEARHWYSRALDIDPQDSTTAAYLAELTEPPVGAGVEKAAEAEVAQPDGEQAPEAESIFVMSGTAVESDGDGGRASDDQDVSDEEPVSDEPVDQEEVAWRKTPRPEESPFVTRTMAELYAKQGYREAALDVYRQLAIRHPEDSEIQDRITELSGPAETRDEPPSPPAEEKNVGSPGDTPGFTGRHFTETELSDTGSFDRVEVDSESPFGELAWEPEPFLEGESAPSDPPPPEGLTEDMVTELTPAEPEVIPEPEPIDEPVSEARFVDLPVALGELQTTIDEAGMGPPPPHAEDISPPPPVPAADSGEHAVVAYSPELPRGEDLPHFTPKVPTIREFFAALGARQPPAHAAGHPITARAAIPGETSAPVLEDLPLATDAFAAMFGDEPVAEEDTRAAFALSGALSGAAHNPTPTSLRTSPPMPSPAIDEPDPQTQESEEDIRRFREWLDGLADS